MPDPWFVTAFGAHYPALYAHRDEAEADRCLDLLPRLAPLEGSGPAAGLPLLDLGCGDGRHLVPLASLSVPVVGLDLSPPLLAGARRRLGDPGGASSAALVRGDMRRLPFCDASLGGVLSLFTAFGYFGPLGANDRVVAEVGRVLAAGGHWFLDYFDAGQVRRELEAAGAPARRDRVAGPCAVTETRRLGPAGEVVIKDVVLTPLPGREDEADALGVGPAGLSYREQVALFGLEDLDALAAAHRLERIAGAGGYEGEPLGGGSRWLLVYRRREAGARGEGA
ncbi:MAG: class I SAM-dependent methyltransferase [Candidatus Krumholzibacteriia bacterium]